MPFAPPILAVPVTIFAFAYEILIISNARAFLARSGATNINSHIELLRSCLSFATFLVNSALFLVNCILAGVIYPIENIEVRIGLFLFEAASVLGILFEIVYLLLNYELNDIAISNWPDPPTCALING
jgi:hypothetical protein